MFTGIITAVGQIVALAPLGASSEHGVRLHVQTPPGYLEDVGLGDSIAINGACMTVTHLMLAQHQFSVDVSTESLNKTCGLQTCGPVNLEKALRAQDRLGGHIVSGHVDGVGHVVHLLPVGESWQLRLRTSLVLAPFLAYKGSLTVNGVSLTVNEVHDLPQGCEVCINLIPHTLQHTTLGRLGAGDAVNLEIDLLARYVQRMMDVEQTRAQGAALT